MSIMYIYMYIYVYTKVMGLFQRNIIIKKYNIFITLLLLTSTFAHRDVNIIPGIIYYSRQALILCNAIM